jgi:hypothetical protein
MPDDISEAPPFKPRSKGLLQPGRLLWARALPWSIVFAVVLWVVYKMAKGAARDLGLGGAGPRIRSRRRWACWRRSRSMC